MPEEHGNDMKNIPNKKYTHVQLDKILRETLNRLQMRDWEVVLFTGNMPPKEHEKYYDHSASIVYDKGMLTATLFVNFLLCAERNENPEWNLKHELSHLFVNYRDDNEELQANIIANILM